MSNPDIQTITPAQVRSVYAGKPGCMCGCRGKHTAHPAHREEVAETQGYPVADSDVSEREVQRVLRLVQSAGPDVEMQEGGIYSADIGTRSYVVYLSAATVPQ